MHDLLTDPPREYSLMPFWFWNDRLEETKVLRQIADFEQHGVFGFVIHPRVGLPRECGWMSDSLLHFMHIAIEEAARREMKVILYDEGMYPSGSSCGQVVARWPHLACRCLALHDPGLSLPPGAHVIQEIEHQTQRKWIVDRPADAYIRGLHYLDEGPAEDEPPAGDILNPATADAVLELVYGVFFRHFGKHFGATILGIFTDEPNPLGKCREKDVLPGTTGIVEQVSRLLGYDFAPHLHQLWSPAEEARPWKEAWHQAIRLRLNETWYGPLSHWCQQHGVALYGHPDRGDETGVQRFLHIPGQDLVWRGVEPGKQTGLEGEEATQAKNTSSAMLHLGRRRNSNEFAGAYGAQTTFAEIQALANWCLVRGVNLLIPHAFYYSLRGPRKDERPPQIGLHTPQWSTGEFTRFADTCRRLCWINSNCRHLCHVAILTHGDRCPWPAAAALLSHQRDFNYLDPQLLLQRAEVTAEGIAIAGMHCRLVVIDGIGPLAPAIRQKLEPLRPTGRIVRWIAAGQSSAPDAIQPIGNPEELIRAVDACGTHPLRIETTSPDLRLRLVEKGDSVYGIILNEGPTPQTIRVCLPEDRMLQWINPATGRPAPEAHEQVVQLRPFELRLARLRPLQAL